MQHNRRVAERVLGIGGSIEIRLQEQDSAIAVKSLADLPKGVFIVTSINLFECGGLTDRNLACLVGLHHLRKLNLHVASLAYAWSGSDGSVCVQWTGL